MVGVSAAQFCRIERGSSKLSIKTLKEICKVLDLNFGNMAEVKTICLWLQLKAVCMIDSTLLFLYL